MKLARKKALDCASPGVAHRCRIIRGGQESRGSNREVTVLQATEATEFHSLTGIGVKEAQPPCGG